MSRNDAVSPTHQSIAFRYDCEYILPQHICEDERTKDRFSVRRLEILTCLFFISLDAGVRL